MLKKVLFLVFVVTTLTNVDCFSQSKILNKHLSISIQNRSITATLEEIEKRTGITFSYNNSILDGNKLISINASNQSLQAILTHILGSQFLFILHNNQILISAKPNASLSQKKAYDIKKTLNRVITDTIHVFIHDTIKSTLIDTEFIRKIDTVTINDTMIIAQTKIDETPRYILNLAVIDAPILGSVIQYNFLSKFSAIKDFIHNSESSYNGNDAGLQIDFSYKKLRYRIGFLRSTMSTRINYSFNKDYIDNSSLYKDSTLIWQYKTILTYFKFKDGDTVRIPIIDSSQAYKTFSHNVRKSEHTATFGTNIIKLIQIPLSIGFPIILNPNNTLTPYISTRLYFVSTQNGYTFNTVTNEVESLTKQNVSQFFFSAAFSIQFEHKINRLTQLFIEPMCNQFVNPMYSDKRIINERLFQYSIAFGLRTLLCNVR